MERLGDMYSFLHKKGYNFFQIGRLTYPEINLLAETEGRHIKIEKREMKKAQNKSKRRNGRFAGR